MIVNAESHLLCALLAWPMDGDPFCPFSSDLPDRAVRPRGVQFEGKLYLAVQDPDSDVPLGEENPKGGWVMRLSVLDATSIIDLGETGGAR
jgi:hypothetical protein